jgi:hypothetical protein
VLANELPDWWLAKNLDQSHWLRKGEQTAQ